MADYRDFDFDATQRHAWDEFTLRLDDVLSVMDATGDLTISAVGPDEATTRPGIRFSMVRPGVIAAFVTGSDGGEPTPSEEEQLRRLGWHEPSGGPAHTFNVEFDQESSADLAALASDTLSSVFGVLHPIFLHPDQLAEILQGETTWTPLAPRKLGREETAVLPGSRPELDALVDEELRRIFGHPPLRNDVGDVAIRVGSTMVFLRSTADGAELLLFSALVHDVVGRSRACEVLNDLNVEARFGRFALHRDRVFVQLAIPAQPFVPAHLHQALAHLSQIADAIDDELAAKLGGRTTF